MHAYIFMLKLTYTFNLMMCRNRIKMEENIMKNFEVSLTHSLIVLLNFGGGVEPLFRKGLEGLLNDM